MVLLRVGDPHHRIDSGQDRLDTLAVRPLDRIEVGQVEDRDVAEGIAAVVANVAIGNAQPAEEAGKIAPARARDPGERVRGRRPADGCVADG